jgi:hypothetical protein
MDEVAMAWQPHALGEAPQVPLDGSDTHRIVLAAGLTVESSAP